MITFQKYFCCSRFSQFDCKNSIILTPFNSLNHSVRQNKFLSFFIILFRSAFRNGLIQGDKLVVYPILQWLFENLAELKKRAYLARYLVKLDVPPDQLADQELYELHENVSITVNSLTAAGLAQSAECLTAEQEVAGLIHKMVVLSPVGDVKN